MSGILDLSNILETFLSNEVLPKSEPMRDPFASYWLHRQDLGDSLQIHFGRIVDCIPYANVYKVQLEHERPVWATPVVQTGLQPFGARQLNTYGLGTGVFCFWHRPSHWCFILCAIPDFITDSRAGHSDWISQAGRSGLLVDRCHREPFDLNNPIINNWSAGRPIDSTSSGEWGAINEHGMKVFLDSYMAILSADEETGVWAFYHDQLLRLAGHNLQLRTALRDLYEINDEEEASSIMGSTPYPWERLGSWTIGNSVSTERGPETVMQSQPEYSRYEPFYDDQQSFRRLLEFKGYLGQLGRKQVAIPPYPTPTDLNRYSIPLTFPGVFREQLALTGAYSIASAKRVSIRKRLCLSVPFQKILPEDKRGDNNTNYKHSGVLGAGDDHKIRSEPRIPVGASDPYCLIRSASALDMGAFIYNWEGEHPFYYHQRDWYIPEEGTAYPFTTNQLCPVFSYLQSQQYLDAPLPLNVPVDHRYQARGGVNYWPNESGIDFLDDGGVLLYDGFGSEIKMTGGSIFISAPGDIFLQSGRNINNWAGRDFIAKAFWCIDLTTSCKDVRIKAENNFLALAGNNKQGGILLESRAQCPAYSFCPNVGEDVIHSGIFLKADTSWVVSRANEVRMQALNASSASPRIVMDAGNGRVEVRAEYIENFIGKAKFDFFSQEDSECSIRSANEWWADHTLIGTNLQVHGKATLGDCLEVNGWINSVNGHIATELSDTYTNMVAKLGDSSVTTINHSLVQIFDREIYLTGLGTQNCALEEKTTINDLFNKVIFSLRTPEQYKTTNFILYESRWQQLARLNDAIPAVWIETSVRTECGTHMYSYPYPGTEPWVTQTSWRKIDPTMYDGVLGLSKPRGALYEEATYGTPQATVLDGVYPIIL